MSKGLTFQCGGDLTVPPVVVEIVYIDGCPNTELARWRVFQAARALGVSVDVRDRVVADAAGHSELPSGSPTVLLEGEDVGGSTGGSVGVVQAVPHCR